MLRFVFGILIIFIPLMQESWSTLKFLGVHTAILFVIVLYETVSKVGAVGRRYDPEGAALVRRAKHSRHLKHDSAKREDVYKARAELQEKNAIRKTTTKKNSKKLGRLHLNRTLSWHPYDGLTLAETGEEDVGMEGELGKMQMKELSTGQRWAYVA